MTITRNGERQEYSDGYLGALADMKNVGMLRGPTIRAEAPGEVVVKAIARNGMPGALAELLRGIRTPVIIKVKAYVKPGEEKTLWEATEKCRQRANADGKELETMVWWIEKDQ